MKVTGNCKTGEFSVDCAPCECGKEETPKVRSSRKAPTDMQIAEWTKRYEEGESFLEMSKEFGVGTTNIAYNVYKNRNFLFLDEIEKLTKELADCRRARMRLVDRIKVLEDKLNGPG